MRAVFFVVLLLPFVIPELVDDAFAADWYSTSWEYRKKIEISLNDEISSDLSNFPVLVSVTDSDFIKASESDGTDIIFTSSDGTTRLAHEIERYDSSTGEVIAWVKIPTLSASATTDIYIYYKGVEEIDTSSVWDSNYRLVYHLNQTSTGTENEFYDVSDNGNDGTGGGEGTKTNDSDRIPTRVEGKIGYGQSFDGPTQPGFKNDGSGDFIFTDNVNNWPGNSGSTSDNDTTVEFWAKVESGQSDIEKMDFFGYSASGNDNEFVLFKVNSLNPSARGNSFDSDVDAATSDWTHLMIVYNPGGIYKIYQNGTLAEESSGAVGNRGQRANGDFVLGAEIDRTTLVNNELQGDLDEFRISDTVRSADWAAASYAIQNSPETYLTVNCEENSTTKSCDIPNTKRSGACGFDRDCTAPRITKHGISETPDGFSINNVIFEENQKFYNENPTVEIGIGELTTIKTRAWENMGPEKIFLAIAYLDMQGTKPDWRDSKAYIEYDINEDNITIHDENKMFLAQASTEIVKDPYGDNQGLEFLDITFSLMFTKPMETSHVAIQVVDHIRNYELVYFKDALKVVDRPISEMPEFPGKIEKANTTPKQDEDIHFVLAVNGTEDTIFAAVDGDAVPLEEMNKEEPKIETPEERDARYHLKAKQSEQYERLLEYIAESQALYPDAWNKIVGSDNVSNQMEHVTDGTKTNVVKNDRRR